MYFPTYKLLRPKFARRFWPEKSDGACFSVSGKPLMRKETDAKGNSIMLPVTFINSNRNHIRFTSKHKALQWLQKTKQSTNHLIQSDVVLIHAK